jgi:hypothetical protein
LKCLVAALDPGDESRDLVLFRRFRGRDLLAFAIEAAHEADFPKQVFRRVGDKIEHAILLTDLGGQHVLVSLCAVSSSPTTSL